MDYIKDALKILTSKCKLKVIKNGISFECYVGENVKLIKFNIIKHKIIIPAIEDTSVLHYTYHFERILRYHDLLLLSDDNAYDFIDFLNNHISVLNHCTICGSDVLNSTINLIACSENECQKNYEAMVTDDDITNYYKYDKLAFNIILLSSYSCLNHPHKEEIFKPIPKSFKSIEDIEKKIKFGFKSFAEIIDIIDSVDNDIELSTKISIHDYAFIKFSIISNKTKMMSHLLFEKQENIFAYKKIKNVLESTNIISFNVQHSLKEEEKTKGKVPSFLFHGSSLSNWYSIFRNGLKNMSGTKLMAHGQAFGAGIYLSNNASVSAGYGLDKYCGTGLYVIGVVQILDDKEKYNKGHYVVPNDDILLLRHVIVVNSKKASNLQFITDYFIKEREQSIIKSSTNMKFIKNKRLENEIASIKKYLNKLDHEFDYEENTNDDKIMFIIKFSGCELSVVYSDGYPIDPPFLFFNKINKNVKSKYGEFQILKKGAVFIKELNIKNWNLSIKMHSIVQKIVENIMEFIDDKSASTSINMNYNDSYEEYVKTCV
jgi:ubiquitin-protein ligase